MYLEQNFFCRFHEALQIVKHPVNKLTANENSAKFDSRSLSNRYSIFYACLINSMFLRDKIEIV